MSAPDLSAEPGWSDIEHLFAGMQRPLFVSADPSPDRYKVAYYRRDADGAVVGKAWLGGGCEGPPGHAHGGSVAALLDEVMGTAGWIAGHRCLAVRISVDFRRSLPLRTLVQFEGQVTNVERRKVSTQGRVVDADGVLYAESEGLFVIPIDGIV